MYAPIHDLHIYPTYSVIVPQRDKSKMFFSKKQIDNRKNLKTNNHSGVLSHKAARRLTNSINWLIASAKNKFIFDKETNKKFMFKLSFITLTLPTIDHGITDHFFKKTLLHGFINQCRYHFSMQNFVWKVEAQENGNIHAHFTTDVFIHHLDLRRIWNKILRTHGILEKYSNKFLNMSFSDYCKEVDPLQKVNIEVLKKRFSFGVSTCWSNPNTTDVHAVHKVNDLGAYLAKYMSKKEEDRRKIKGKLWGCSHSLSSQNKLILELHGSEDFHILSPFHQPDIDYKTIQVEDKLTKEKRTVGEIYFYSLNDWGTKIKGFLLDCYNEFRLSIRQNMDIDYRLQFNRLKIPPDPSRKEVFCPF